MQLALQYMMNYSLVCVCMDLCVHWIFCTSYIVSNHMFDTDHCRQIERWCHLSPTYFSNFWVSWKPRRVVLWRLWVLGFFVWLSTAHERYWKKILSAGWYVMGNGTLLFVFFALYWMSFFLSIPLSLIKQWLLLAWHFSSPRTGSLFIGADAFDPESLAVWNTGDALFWMTTLCRQLLMFICWLVVYVSWHNTIFTGNVSVQKRDVSSGCFISEFYSGVNIVGKSKKRWRFSSDSVHFMSTSSMKRKQESGLWKLYNLFFKFPHEDIYIYIVYIYIQSRINNQ